MFIVAKKRKFSCLLTTSPLSNLTMPLSSSREFRNARYCGLAKLISSNTTAPPDLMALVTKLSLKTIPPSSGTYLPRMNSSRLSVQLTVSIKGMPIRWHISLHDIVLPVPAGPCRSTERTSPATSASHTPMRLSGSENSSPRDGTSPMYSWRKDSCPNDPGIPNSST